MEWAILAILLGLVIVVRGREWCSQDAEIPPRPTPHLRRPSICWTDMMNIGFGAQKEDWYESLS